MYSLVVVLARRRICQVFGFMMIASAAKPLSAWTFMIFSKTMSAISWPVALLFQLVVSEVMLAAFNLASRYASSRRRR